ncbi:cadherin repeat domain-containing protein, partial [Vibrio paucivorans]
FTNDYETLANSHDITVIASDGVNDVEITVTLNEQDVNEPPVFEPPIEGDEYVFAYDENTDPGVTLGQVTANDPESLDVTYSIGTNVQIEGVDLFQVDDQGNISLTTAGAEAFTNNYEELTNSHVITVVASDGVNETEITVTLNEQDVNELPTAEDFDVDAEDNVIVPIVFDSDVAEDDHIADEDDDFNGLQVNVMLTSLPEYGVLLYTDDMGETRELTAADLHVDGDPIDANKLLNPDNIVYVPGSGDPFEIGYSGDPEDIVLTDGFFNWGVEVSPTEREITLDNGNTISLSITDNNNKPLKQYSGEQPHVGHGIGDTDGRGMNKQETLILDLRNNPLGVVAFGLDGMGGAFNTNSNIAVSVTYTFADGTTETVEYQKDPGDVGNAQILYEFTYSSPDNEIVQMDFSSNGGNWELRYVSGSQTVEEDVTFDYMAVDSELAVSEEATVTIDVSDSPAYQVLAAANEDELNAEQGNDVLVGDNDANVFTWLDGTLDTGTDVIMDFELTEDMIDLDDILDDTESADIDELIANIGVEIVDDNVELTIEHDGGEQTIVIEDGANILSDYIGPGNEFDSIELLGQIIKNDAA